MVSSAFNISNQVDPKEKAAINTSTSNVFLVFLLSGFAYEESVWYKLIYSHVKSFGDNFPS